MADGGLPRRVLSVELTRQENRPPEYRAITRAGQLAPVVDHEPPGGPRVLAKSGAIVLYACRKAGRHVPADAAAHDTAMQWFMQAATDIGGASSGLQQVSVAAPEKVPSTIELFEQRFARYFGYVDRQLEAREFLAGEFSFADIMLYPNYLLRRPLIERLADLPHLRAWGERMARRPGVQAGMRLLKGA